MAPMTAANAAKFAGSIAEFGDRMSSVMHDFMTLENPYCERLGLFMGCLAASVRTLNQVRKLLEQQAALTDAEKARAFFAQDGLDYVVTLAEECSVAMCRVKTIIEEGGSRGRERVTASTWPSFTVIDEKDQRTFTAPALDNIEFFNHLNDMNWYRGRVRYLSEVSERLEKVQLLLLLVIQVITVRQMTMKSPTGSGDLKSLVEYHSRIERAADLADITHRSRSRSSSRSYYTSDSDSDFSVRPAHKRKPFKPLNVRPPPMPPHCVPPPPMPQALPYRPLGPPIGHNPIHGVQIVDVKCDIPKESHPPSYTEIPTMNGVDRENSAPTGINSTPSNLSGTTVVSEKGGKKEEEGKPTNSEARKVIEKPDVNQARLLNSPVGLGTKFKSLFRSKSSLEAEMKRTLADDNASLSAFVIQGGDYFKVPHSAFHSLEYTHMRTILSQLRDNTWFKTFSDLREPEHEALTGLGRKRMEKDKWMKRELVVLKVLHENRLNAYVRVLENCIGLDEYLPQHENGRIVLSIFRDTECTDDQLISPGRRVVGDLYENRRSGTPVEVRLDGPISSGPPPAPGPRLGGPPAMGWKGPGGPPPLGGVGNPQYMSCHRSDITPHIPLDEKTARENLTTYKAYTLRPVTPQASPTDAEPPAAATWTRCFITQEHDTKAVLQERIAAFNRRGDSIIDLKMQLIEPQSAQISRLIDESNRLEFDRDFEYKLVELSMVDRERGLVRRQTRDLHVDAMHIVLQRSPKENINAMNIRRPFSHPPPPPFRPIPRPVPEVVMVNARAKDAKFGPGKRGRRTPSVSSFTTTDDSSASDSDSSTASTVSIRISKGRRMSRKGKKGARSADSDSDSDNDEKPRWKKDPVIVKIDKKDRKNDIVEVLLDRWTPAGEGKPKIEEKTEDEKKAENKKDKKSKKSKKERRRRRRQYSDSDTCSLADD